MEHRDARMVFFDKLPHSACQPAPALAVGRGSLRLYDAAVKHPHLVGGREIHHAITGASQGRIYSENNHGDNISIETPCHKMDLYMPG